MIVMEKIKKMFLDKTIPEPNTGCLLWTGCIEDRGYGKFKFNNKTVRAHRVSYELFVGKIKNNLHVLHKCDTRACVEPKHLFLGTNQENMNDAKIKGRLAKQKTTHCPKGHEYSFENTYVRPITKFNKFKRRMCIICRKNRKRS